jgi:hypothetical protein
MSGDIERRFCAFLIERWDTHMHVCMHMHMHEYVQDIIHTIFDSECLPCYVCANKMNEIVKKKREGFQFPLLNNYTLAILKGSVVKCTHV